MAPLVNNTVLSIYKSIPYLMHKQVVSTLTLIFRETFAKYCLLILKTCFVKQHCDISPKSVSQIRLMSPENIKLYLGKYISVQGEGTIYARQLADDTYHTMDHCCQGGWPEEAQVLYP